MSIRDRIRAVKATVLKIGPGLITGASDDDPAGIATYSQTGAQFGYHQLWTALFTLPFMTVIQEMCGRIGLVSGTGLAGNIRKHYSKWLLYFVVADLFIANTINIGADLGAMAASAQLLVNVRFDILLFAVTTLTLVLEIFVSYKTYAKYLRYLTISLAAYIITAFVVSQPWATIARATVIPYVTSDTDYLMNIVAVLGTTISPYLFFWQANQEVEEEVAHGQLKSMGRGKPRIRKHDIRNMRVDTVIGMLFSNLVMFFIIVTAASTLGANGVTNIETATEAAEALRPLAGDLAFALFAIGIIGTGLLAVPVLAGSASYALAEAFRWKAGLYRKFHEAYGFYSAIAVATLLGLVMNFTQIPPFKMLYYSAVLNGIAAPPLMVVILLISNNSNIMRRRTNSLSTNVIGWIITAVMAVAAVLLLEAVSKLSS